jgi:oligosaccharide repeat unit polymerase
MIDFYIFLLLSISFLTISIRRVVTPIALYSLVLGFWFLLFFYGSVDYYDLPIETVNFILMCFIFFSLGCFFSELFPLYWLTRIRLLNIKVQWLLVIVIGIFIYLIKGVNFTDIISSAVHGRESGYVGMSLVRVILSNILFALGPFCYLRYLKVGDKKLLIPVLLTIIVSILSMGRALILVNLIWCMFIYIIYTRKPVNIQYFKIPLICSFMFISIGYLRGSFSEGEDDLLYFILSKTQHYITGSLFAFNSFFVEFKNDDIVNVHILNSFPAISKLLSFVLGADAVNYFKYEAVFTPRITNVFTVYREILSDFGVYGSWVFMLFFGFVTQFFYRLSQSQNRSDFSIMFSAFLFLFLLYSPFYPVTLFIFVIFSLFMSFFLSFDKP